MARHPSLPSAAVLTLLALLLTTGDGKAQVHYDKDGRPWRQQARGGPDAEVPGWYYNLGLTGIRVELVEDAPTHLLVRYVFDDAPAHGRVLIGDHIVGAGEKPFETPHRNGYGMDVFGPEGPILDFAVALEESQGKAGRGRLEVELLRDGETVEQTLPVGQRYGAFSPTFPADCRKSERILAELLEFLLEQQRDDGSWGNPIHDTFAALALLASGKEEQLAAAKRNVRFHARTTKPKDYSSLINWRYTAAAIVMSEYHLATGERWVLPELEEVRDFLESTQYLSLEQVNPKVKETHPGSYPKDAQQQHGGWGHNPGFEGYGPIAMITGQGALAFSLMHHCGIEIDRGRHDAAFAFLERGTGKNGYLWYNDRPAGDDRWADMGRTGAAGIANLLSPWSDGGYRERALRHARVIGEHPQSFPDTHGSPIMGMGYAAMAANADPASFRRLMDANRWWFTLAQCNDGTFYYQPNRDNAGYGGDSRLSASAVTAFLLSIPARDLMVTGRSEGR